MKISSARPPYIKTNSSAHDVSYDLLIALAPIMIWSVFVFGARVITICALDALFSVLFDMAARRYVLKTERSKSFDPLAVAYGILAAFALPVSAPLWFPVLSALFVAIAKNLKVFRGRRLFSPFVFSAAAVNLFCRALNDFYTKPRAYFNAFSFAIDKDLLNAYRVLSPLDYIKNGEVYEAGALPQFFGYASGHIGEIAVAAMLISAVWLAVRKRTDIMFSFTMLLTIFVLGLVFPSDDAESAYFAYSIILSGAIFYLAVFVPADGSSIPATRSGRLVFAVVAGLGIFAARKYFGGFEMGYYIILLLNAATPIIEKLTLPRPTGAPKKHEKR